MRKDIDYKLYDNNFDNIKTKGVYVIQDLNNGRVKIGITDNLSRRYKEILKSFKFCGTIPDLKIIYFIEYKDNFKLEQYLHKELRDYNYLNEWFDLGNNFQLILDAIGGFKCANKKPVTYQYYKYKADDNFEGKELYIYCDNIKYSNRSQACWVLDDIYMSIFKKDSDFINDTSKAIPVIPNESFAELFTKLNTQAIVLVEDEYISLEDYFTKVYNKNLLTTLNNIKEYVNNVVDETSVENSNIELEDKIKNISITMKTIQEDFQIQLN